jgi:uroporphyrin-III C-methyltransferase
MKQGSNAILYIIGAGPGDPELITLKGMKAIQQADVILYDAFVCEELLRQAEPACKLIAVGQKEDGSGYSQEEVHHLIGSLAHSHRCIVRLKNDDPLASGHGHEELEYALRHGISTEVIPGISRALAVPAGVGIPLTKRGVNESFWVVVGSAGAKEMSPDLLLAAQSSATVIVLNGMAHLEAIAKLFQEVRSASEPVAVIGQATGPDQRMTIGRAGSIIHEACLVGRQAGDLPFTSHDMIVIGKVVEECTPQALQARVVKFNVAV